MAGTSDSSPVADPSRPGQAAAGPRAGGPHLGGPHFAAPPPEVDGIVRALPARGAVPSGGAAAWLNALAPTARAYEPLWRHRSVGLLSRGAFTTARELATMRAWLSPIDGRDVLDLGCSAGLYARTLTADGARVHALDASLAFLREAKRLAERDGVALTLVHADAHALPYEDGGFDAVAVGATLNEFADPERALAEVARVLRPGGRAWFMYAARGGGPGRAVQALMGLGGLRFPDPAEVDGWATNAGLTPIRSERRGPVVMALYGRGEGLPALDAR